MFGPNAIYKVSSGIHYASRKHYLGCMLHAIWVNTVALFPYDTAKFMDFAAIHSKDLYGEVCRWKEIATVSKMTFTMSVQRLVAKSRYHLATYNHAKEYLQWITPFPPPPHPPPFINRLQQWCQILRQPISFVLLPEHPKLKAPQTWNSPNAP